MLFWETTPFPPRAKKNPTAEKYYFENTKESLILRNIIHNGGIVKAGNRTSTVGWGAFFVKTRLLRLKIFLLLPGH